MATKRPLPPVQPGDTATVLDPHTDKIVTGEVVEVRWDKWLDDGWTGSAGSYRVFMRVPSRSGVQTHYSAAHLRSRVSAGAAEAHQRAMAGRDVLRDVRRETERTRHRLANAMLSADTYGSTSLLASIGSMREAASELERQTAALVGVARARGASWTEIGAVLGTTRQGARQRYGTGTTGTVIAQTETLEGI